MKKLSALTLSLLLSLGSFSVMANENDRRDSADNDRHGSSTNSAFSLIDTNGDGSIDKDEAKNSGISDDRFEELDTNNDGKLSESEYQAQVRDRTGDS